MLSTALVLTSERKTYLKMKGSNREKRILSTHVFCLRKPSQARGKSA